MTSPIHLQLADLRQLRDKLVEFQRNNYLTVASPESYPWNSPQRRLCRAITELNDTIETICQANPPAKNANETIK